MRNSPFIARIAYAFETNESACLVLDYACGGDLYHRMLYDSDANEVHTLSENKVRIIASEILIGLEELHRNKIVHRDLKLENILIDGEGHIVITDFGLSMLLYSHKKHNRAFSVCGTVQYMAPEMLDDKKIGYDFSVDLWSLGVLMYELLSGYTPYSDSESEYCPEETKQKILNENFNMPENCSADVCDLLQHLLDKNPKTRLGCGPQGISDLKNHRFFKGINWDNISKKETKAAFEPCNFEMDGILSELELSQHSSSYGPLFPCSYSYVAPGLHNSSLQMMEVEDNFQENLSVLP